MTPSKFPSIAWGRNAKYAQHLKVGDHLKIWGRVQSREYQKKKEDGEVLSKIAYEVSISKMEIDDDNNRQDEDDDELGNKE